MESYKPTDFDPAEVVNLEGVFRPARFQSDGVILNSQTKHSDLALLLDVSATRSTFEMEGWWGCIKDNCRLWQDPLQASFLFHVRDDESTWYTPHVCVACGIQCVFHPLVLVAKQLSTKGLALVTHGNMQRLFRQETHPESNHQVMGRLCVFADSTKEREMPAGQYTGCVLGSDGQPIKRIYSSGQDSQE